MTDHGFQDSNDHNPAKLQELNRRLADGKPPPEISK
jgi:hypothetical protein